MSGRWADLVAPPGGGEAVLAAADRDYRLGRIARHDHYTGTIGHRAPPLELAHARSELHRKLATHDGRARDAELDHAVALSFQRALRIAASVTPSLAPRNVHAVVGRSSPTCNRMGQSFPSSA